MSDSTKRVAPWHFRLAKRWIRAGVRGPGLWLRFARAVGLLRGGATYQLTPNVLVDVPIARRETMYDEQETRDYERPLLDAVFAAAQDLPAPATLIDCGADIGLFSLGLSIRLPALRQIVAVEPNPVAQPWLDTNLSRLPFPTQVARAAVGERSGRGSFESPGYDRSDHARYVAPGAAGSLPIFALDDFDWSAAKMERPRNLVLKVDIEGGELAALQGAKRLLRDAEHALVVVELHPQVLLRTGQDPKWHLRCLSQVRPFRFEFAEAPGVLLDETFAGWTDGAPRHLVARSV